MGNIKMKSKLALTTALAGALIWTDAAIAQDDTIVVTATRRASNIQDVPIAVTAVDTEDLDRAGVTDVRGLDRLSASFNSSNSQSGGTTVFRIRGVGTTGNNAGLESSVGVFLDGVYLSRPNVALSDLVDVEQIEVLRGPQGTLFGRNTSAGALSISTKKPDLNEVEAFANATYGNFDFVNFQGGLSIPLIQDTLGFRISGATQNRDHFIESTSGAKSHDRDRYSVRGQLYWEPSDAVSFRLIGDYSKVDEECCDAIVIRETPLVALGAYAAAGLTGGAGVTASGDAAFEDLISNGGQFRNPYDQWGISGELNWDMGVATMTYIPSYREFNTVADSDTDFTGLDMFRSFAPQEIQTMSHEVRFQGTAWDDRLDWLIGGYYSDEDIDQIQTITLGPDYQRNASALLIAGGVTALGSNPMLALAQGVSSDGNFASNRYTQFSESFSVFTHNIFSVTDRIDLTLGLRYVDESKDGAFEQLSTTALPQSACFNVITNPALTNPMSPLAPLLPNAFALQCFPFSTPADLHLLNPAFGAFPLPRTFSETFKDDELIYTGKISIALTDDVNLYGGYTHGFKSGGFNLDSTAAAGGSDPRFNSEKVNAIEVGLKSSLANGRIIANLAAFHMDLEDYQVLEFTGVQFSTFAVPSAKSTGAELELLAAVTDSLTLNTSLTYTDARFPDDCADGLGTVPAAVAARVNNLCGARLTNSSEFVSLFGATYETQLTDAGWGMFFTGNARYESERRTSTQPTNVNTGNPLFGDIQPGNIKANLRLGFTSPEERFAIEFWGNNITDKRTKSITFNTTLRGTGDVASRSVFTQDPRTYGVTVRMKY